MTDIVERLRRWYEVRGGGESVTLYTEAAAEIERQRAALQDIAIGLGERVLSQDEMRARAREALNPHLGGG
jgi:hypothetical protein